MMAGDHADLADAIRHIDPSTLSYQEWVGVGMALKESGFGPETWEEWSASDPRHKPGECHAKWDGFGSYGGERVRSGTIVAMARERGWEPRRGGGALDINEGLVLADDPIDQGWIENVDPTTVDADLPVTQVLRYLSALFSAEDMVDVVTNAVEGRPRDGGHTWQVGSLVGRLKQAQDSDAGLRSAIGDYSRAAGAWVRLNPLDGRGHGNANVVEYRYALVESDEVPIEKQFGMIREMNLPCAAVVSSGGKSVHAVVRIGASDAAEYQSRVDLLYRWCRKKGFVVDGQNKNPSRLSRLPGVMRGDTSQKLLATDVGPSSWDEWREWAEEAEDDLPPDHNDDWDSPIVLSPPLIGTERDGVLRQGQKMVLAAPSKVGKSYAIIDLAEAIACGGTWLGYPCAKGPVFYVNLEIDDMSFRMRQHVVWKDRDDHLDVGDGLDEVKRNFVRWDLRGHACGMDRLAPLLTRRVLRRGPRGTFMAVIVDPIYKVNGGDENDAQAISDFTNQLDLVAERCGCAVIYVHHHAKGNLGARSSQDRMSGSGVFARDADAILDMCPLELTEEQVAMTDGRPVYRLESTLREFPTPKPRDLVFRFPRFYPVSGFESAKPMGADPITGRNRRRKEESQGKWAAIAERLGEAIESCVEEGVPPTRSAVLMTYNAFNPGEELTSSQLRDLTTPSRRPSQWCPYRVSGPEDGFVLYDPREGVIDIEQG